MCRGFDQVKRRLKSHRLVRRDLGRVGGVMNLAEVRLQEGESIDNALRRFKRKVQTEDIIKEVKRHSFLPEAGARSAESSKPWRESVLEKRFAESTIKFQQLGPLLPIKLTNSSSRTAARPRFPASPPDGSTACCPRGRPR